MNASTFTVRVVASTGADVAAALSARRRRAQRAAARRRAQPGAGDARRGRARGRRRALRQGRAGPRRAADGLRPPRVPRRGPARPGAAPHEPGDRLAPLRGRRGARAGRARRAPARKPDRVLATNVEFWSAVVLDHADGPGGALHVACSRARAWPAGRAHILEQKREGRLIRPSAKYVGPPPRPLSSRGGWARAGPEVAATMRDDSGIEIQRAGPGVQGRPARGRRHRPRRSRPARSTASSGPTAPGSRPPS